MKLDVLKGEPTALIQIAFARETRGDVFALFIYYTQVFLKKKKNRPPAFHTCVFLIQTTFMFRSSDLHAEL